MDVFLTNTVFSLRLRADASSMPLAARLRRFLSPYLWPAAGVPAPDLSVALHDASGFQADWRARCTAPLTIRETYARDFTLKVLRGVLEDGSQLAWDAHTGVGYRYWRERCEVDFYGGEQAFIHLIELVRYHGLLVEQAKGSAVLHSSAVIDEDTGEVTAFAGIKGAGKTTTMLEHVLYKGWRYFSGDKLLLDVVDGRLRARGWPDYPHVGLGALRQHPALVRALGEPAQAVQDSARADTDKILLAPEVFARAVGTSPTGSGWLTQIVLPEVALDDALHSRPLQGQEIDGLLQALDIFEWPYTFITSTWHGMPPAGRALQRSLAAPVAAALAAVSWVSVRGRANRGAALAGV